MNAEPLLLRADASAEIGTGHVMRCLALAQAWQDGGGTVAMLSASLPETLKKRLLGEGVRVSSITAEPGGPEDAAATAALAKELNAPIVLDGYQFSVDYQRYVRPAARTLVVVDDFGRIGHYDADVVLDQNLGTDHGRYANSPNDCVKLLGPKYALLRREFRLHAFLPKRIGSTATRILVTLGGAAPLDALRLVAKACHTVAGDSRAVRLLLGALAPSAQVACELTAVAPKGTELLGNELSVIPHFEWTELAIGAGGSTTWELAAAGVPALLMPIADNQRPVVSAAAAAGIAIAVPEYGKVSSAGLASAVRSLSGDAASLRRMSEAGLRIVDTAGAARLIARLDPRGCELILRNASWADAGTLLAWRNDPVTRQSAFDEEVITWERHARWLTERLQDGRTTIFIGEHREGDVLGQVRFELCNSESALIDVVVAPEMRGRGYGTLLVSQAVREYQRRTRVTAVHAYVKPTNQPSLRTFTRAGFKRHGFKRIKNNEAEWLVFEDES